MTPKRPKSRARTLRRITAMCAASVLLLSSLGLYAKPKPSLLGGWQLNRELTEQRRPKLPKSKSTSSGFGSIGIGGVILPTPGGNTRSNPGGATARLPAVLACQSMTLTKAGSDILVTCPELLKPRKFTIGNIHGRKVKFSNRHLSERYSSTSRRVTHAFRLEKSGLMEIKVTVKQKHAKLLTYILVFDRATKDASNA